MNIKRLLSLIMTAVIFLSILSIPAFAEETEENHTHIEIIFEEGVSDEFKGKATHLILNDEEYIESSTYAISCSVFGHVFDSENVTFVSHKVYTSSPRCLRALYNVETCLRCDYTQKTLTSSTRIICCS